jgi:polysaccharide export outer membrane protein
MLPQPRKLANGQAAPSVALHGPGFAAPPAPTELRKESLPPYVIEPPDILLVESSYDVAKLKYEQRIRGQHLVRPDGTISLGLYGSVYVAGMTLDQARRAIADQIAKTITNFPEDSLNVDVLAYNSKVYYVITDGGGYGEQVYRIPITGSETVLDALALVNGLPWVASKKHIWVARRTAGDVGYDQVLPVDYIGITQRGATASNYQVFPGDRIYVKADRWRTLDARVGKVLSPIERILGITLLGSETVNSIQNRGLGSTSR